MSQVGSPYGHTMRSFTPSISRLSADKRSSIDVEDINHYPLTDDFRDFQELPRMKSEELEDLLQSQKLILGQ